MLTTVKTAHHQLEEGYRIGLSSPVPKGTFSHIIFCGMGGSALAADMMRDYVREEVTIDVVKDYYIPTGLARESSLVILCSYSGTTEETISCFHHAKSLKLPMLIMAHGGMLEELAQENNAPFYRLPKIEETRCAVGYSIGILIGIFEQLGIHVCSKQVIASTIEFVDGHLDELENLGKALAEKLHKKVPVFYASASKGSLARLMKIHCNENAKIQSFYGEIPEINHNEMVGYTQLLMDPILVFIHSHFDYSKNKLRMEVMKELLEERQITCLDIQTKGFSWLDEVYYMLLLAYYTSYFLAEQYGVPYKELELVKEFKHRLSQ